MEHRLKTLPEYFDDVASGRKPFEVRRDDRPFAEGDTLLLEEWDGSHYTGRTLNVRVTHVLRGEYCRDGYCIMGIKLDGTNGDCIRSSLKDADNLCELLWDGYLERVPDFSTKQELLDWLKQPAERGM